MASASGLSVDVGVVGSGAGGAAVAGELRRAGATVAMVEAGPQLGGRPGSHIRNRWIGDRSLSRFGMQVAASLGFHARAEAAPRDIPAAFVAHAFGGGLVYWTHHCPTPHESEWPVFVASDERTALLSRARAALRVTSSLRGGVRQELLIRAVAEVVVTDPHRPVQTLPLAGEKTPRGIRYSGADDLLLGDDRDPGPGIHVLADHVAQRVIVERGRAVGIEAVPRGGGGTLGIRAKAIVIAAGALGSPQLLFASGIRPDALGRHLMDHQMVSARVELDAALLEGAPPDDPEFAVWVPMGNSRPHHLQIVQSPFTPQGQPTGSVDGRTVDLVAFCGIAPHWDNALQFDERRTDPFGLPVIDARLVPSAEDHRRLAGAVAEQITVAARVGRIQDGVTTRVAPLGASIHLMGTTRLGSADDGTSVADAHGRVWGYDGLYVAGNGVLGAYHASNPTVLTVALALRTADAVRESA